MQVIPQDSHNIQTHEVSISMLVSADLVSFLIVKCCMCQLNNLPVLWVVYVYMYIYVHDIFSLPVVAMIQCLRCTQRSMYTSYDFSQALPQLDLAIFMVTMTDI